MDMDLPQTMQISPESGALVSMCHSRPPAGSAATDATPSQTITSAVTTPWVPL